MTPSSAYRPGRELARGGMGAVLDARDTKLGRSVAMKVMLRHNASEEEQQRFLQEARVLGQLAHPNIVPVHDLGTDEQGRTFYIMKLVVGVTLHDVISKLKAGDKETLAKYPLPALLTIFQKVCDAVGFAHARGIIHRDLKPQNIMVGEFGEVLVMDWGLAKLLPGGAAAEAAAKTAPVLRGQLGQTGPTGTLPLERGSSTRSSTGTEDAFGETMTSGEGTRSGSQSRAPDEQATLAPGSCIGTATPKLSFSTNAPEPTTPSGLHQTLEGAVMGTPHFMSPEQAEGRVAELDGRSDIFSLGGILYALLTLRPPVEGDSLEEILSKVRSGTIAPPTAFNAPSSSAQAQPAATGAVVEPKKIYPLAHCPGGKVPSALSAVTMKALTRDKARRYQTVAEFTADIAAYQNGFATIAENAGLLKQLQLLILRHKILASSVVVLLLLTAGFIVRVMASERHARASEQEALRNEAKAIASREKDEAALGRLRDTAPTFHEQALALLKESQLEAALEKIGFAVDLLPADVEFRLFQANLLQTLLRLDAAKAGYAAALRLAPTNALAQTNLAFCDHLAAQVRRGEWRGNTLTNLLATLRRQDRLDEAEYLDSYLGAEQRQLVETWTARLKEAKLTTSALIVNQGLTFGLHISHFRDNIAGFEMLKGMPLRTLKVSDAAALRSLAPLAGMPLERLEVSAANLESIQPLKGLPLTDLDLGGCRLAGDLRSLIGMPLVSLDLHSWSGSDLRPLAGMRIANLDLSGCPNLTDLSPLAGLPLTNLMLGGCKQLKAIAPLAGMPLQRLFIQNTAVSDLTPLQGMPLVELDLHGCFPVKSLAPLSGAKLRWLDIAYVAVTDLSPLRGMPLEYLDAGAIKQLRNITPLAGLPLRQLYICNTGTPDLSPLASCRDLEWLTLPRGSTGMEAVRRLPNLCGLSYSGLTQKTTKGWPTLQEFWKAYDAEKKP